MCNIELTVIFGSSMLVGGLASAINTASDCLINGAAYWICGIRSDSARWWWYADSCVDWNNWRTVTGYFLGLLGVVLCSRGRTGYSTRMVVLSRRCVNHRNRTSRRTRWWRIVGVPGRLWSIRITTIIVVRLAQSGSDGCLIAQKFKSVLRLLQFVRHVIFFAQQGE